MVGTSCSASGSVARRICTPPHSKAASLGHSSPTRAPSSAEPPSPVRTIAVVLSTPTSYGEIAVVDLAGDRAEIRTGHSPDPTEIELFLREEREFTISDGTAVQGWLVRDPQASTPQPLLLDIHGGPHNAWNGAADPVHLYHQELAARGWAVLLLNPRGSDGYGEDFYRAAIEDWGESDARDFLEPIDALVAEGLADADRLAVTGYSYGGYMTCYLTSRDKRFAAAVAGGVVSDLVSMGGTSDDAHLLSHYELGGEPWAAATDTGRCRLSPAWKASSRRRSSITARPTAGVQSARPSSGTRHYESEACRPRSSSTRTKGTCSSSTGGRRTAATSTAASQIGWSSMPSHAAPGGRHGSTTRTGGVGWRSWRNATACPVPSSASSASATVWTRRALPRMGC